MLGDFYKEEEKLLLTILTILFLRPYEFATKRKSFTNNKNNYRQTIHFPWLGFTRHNRDYKLRGGVRDSPIKGPSPLGSIITPSPVKQPGARHVIRLSSLHSISPRTEGGREGHAGGSSVKFALGATDNTELVRWIMRGRRGGLDRFPFNSHSRRRATPPEKGLSLSLSLLASRNL